MTMENIPQLEEDWAKELVAEIDNEIASGHLDAWLDKNLIAMKETNPILYAILTKRSRNFAFGAYSLAKTGGEDVDAIVGGIMLSMAVEHVLLLRLLDKGFKAKAEMEAFEKMMKKWWGDNAGPISK